jgi:hypothetical protein
MQGDKVKGRVQPLHMGTAGAAIIHISRIYLIVLQKRKGEKMTQFMLMNPRSGEDMKKMQAIIYLHQTAIRFLQHLQ